MMNDDTLYQYANGELVPLSAEEITAYRAEQSLWQASANVRISADVRRRRDDMLRDSDVALLRALETAADISHISAYRQQLRDIPQQLTFPDAVTWPTMP
jgi:hypothetical protein